MDIDLKAGECLVRQQWTIRRDVESRRKTSVVMDAWDARGRDIRTVEVPNGSVLKCCREDILSVLLRICWPTLREKT
jgi:hypothetical protein